MNSEVYSTISRVYEVCEDELKEYEILTYNLAYTREVDPENEEKIKLIKSRMKVNESFAIDSICENFLKRNHDRFKCALLTLVKEFERINQESLNKVKQELNIKDNYSDKYVDMEELKWLDEVSNPVYREYLVTSVVSKNIESFEEYAKEYGSLKLSLYYNENLIEEYERLSYLYLKAVILEENNLDKINRLKNRLKIIEDMAKDNLIKIVGMSNEEINDALIKSHTIAYIRAIYETIDETDSKSKVLKK